MHVEEIKASNIKLCARSFFQSENWCPEVHKRVFILRNTTPCLAELLQDINTNSCKSLQLQDIIVVCRIEFDKPRAKWDWKKVFLT